MNYQNKKFNIPKYKDQTPKHPPAFSWSNWKSVMSIVCSARVVANCKWHLFEIAALETYMYAQCQCWVHKCGDVLTQKTMWMWQPNSIFFVTGLKDSLLKECCLHPVMLKGGTNVKITGSYIRECTFVSHMYIVI